MRVLTIDIGGTNVKVLSTGQTIPRKAPSGPTMTPKEMGAALVADGVVIPMELAHLPYKRRTFEGYVGARALRRLGRKKWQKHVEVIVAGFIEALRVLVGPRSEAASAT